MEKLQEGRSIARSAFTRAKNKLLDAFESKDYPEICSCFMIISETAQKLFGVDERIKEQWLQEETWSEEEFLQDDEAADEYRYEYAKFEIIFKRVSDNENGASKNDSKSVRGNGISRYHRCLPQLTLPKVDGKVENQKKHAVLLCPDANKANGANSSENPELMLANKANETTLLQSLTVKNETVRASIDTGAQGSHIQTDVVSKLQLIPRGEETLRNTSLVEGKETKEESHKVYDLTVKSMTEKVTLNMTSLSKEKIGGYVPRIRHETSVSQPNLTDIGGNTPDTGLSNGADHADKIMTGSIICLNEDLFASQTKLGWTLQGKAEKFIIESKHLMNEGKFDLRGWWMIKELFRWNPLKPSKEVTRRELLSICKRVFDPGGANLFSNVDWDSMEKYSMAHKVKWIFNPPPAPWWGGWWERKRMEVVCIRPVQHLYPLETSQEEEVTSAVPIADTLEPSDHMIRKADG